MYEVVKLEITVVGERVTEMLVVVGTTVVGGRV